MTAPAFPSDVRGGLWRHLLRLLGQDRLRVSLWHKFMRPPWGGANQFMLALKKGLKDAGVAAYPNRIGGVDVHLLQAVWFDAETFEAETRRGHLRAVHRVDGLIQIGRPNDAHLDDLMFKLNRQFASVTVFQSQFTLECALEAGFQPVNPVLIGNASDPRMFHRRGRVPFSQERKIRLVASSWSPNPMKGGPIYKWLEENLDWDRFEFTFVGRCSEKLERACVIEPVPSQALADILRQQDIYIVAARNEPCSNALIEALTCGLPAVYLDSGSNPEVVGTGGLPFQGVEDLLETIDRVVADYERFQTQIQVNSIEGVVEQYIKLLEETAQA